MKEVRFNPEGADLSLELVFTGFVFLEYSLKYYSKDKQDPKLIFNEYGTNEQDHDDKFMLLNPKVDNEAVSKQHGRVVIITGSVLHKSPYKVVAKVYQGDELIDEESNDYDPTTNPIDMMHQMGITLKSEEHE